LAADSAVEGGGFEPSVPRAIRLRSEISLSPAFAYARRRQPPIIERRRHSAEAGDYRLRPLLHGTRNRKLESISSSRQSVSLVHGHDGEAKSEVARFIEKLGFKAIVLHELTNRGRTIIAKFGEEA
jgi:Predicted nucleotide-binding protein containing TIR-like domain